MQQALMQLIMCLRDQMSLCCLKVYDREQHVYLVVEQHVCTFCCDSSELQLADDTVQRNMSQQYSDRVRTHNLRSLVLCIVCNRGITSILVQSEFVQYRLQYCTQ